MYSLSSFSKKIKELRLCNKLTQREVSELAYIDIRTLSRIENGLVIPKIETLEILSQIYHEDLLEILIESRFEDYDEIKDIRNNIEYKINNSLFMELELEKDNLSTIYKTIEYSYLKQKISQIILFIDAILFIENNKFDIAYNTIIKSIPLTIYDFDVNNYKKFYYNTFEIRLLMLLAHINYRMKNIDLYHELLKYCYNQSNESDNIFPRLCINLSNSYKRMNNYSKALEILNKGIESALQFNIYYDLDLLYYSKGTTEYNLGIKDYRVTLEKAISFCDLTERTQNKQKFKDKLKKHFDIEL